MEQPEAKSIGKSSVSMYKYTSFADKLKENTSPKYVILSGGGKKTAQTAPIWNSKFF